MKVTWWWPQILFFLGVNKTPNEMKREYSSISISPKENTPLFTQGATSDPSRKQTSSQQLFSIKLPTSDSLRRQKRPAKSYLNQDHYSVWWNENSSLVALMNGALLPVNGCRNIHSHATLQCQHCQTWECCSAWELPQLSCPFFFSKPEVHPGDVQLSLTFWGRILPVFCGSLL